MGKKNRKTKDEVSLDIEGVEVAPESVEVDVTEPHEEVVAEVAAELASDEAKAEAYAEQPGEEVAEGDAAPSTKRKPPTRVAKLSLKTGSASEIIVRQLGADAASFFALDATQDNTDEALHRRMNETLARIDGLDKKSREKAVNLFNSLAAGREPSIYTKQAIGFLSDGNAWTLKQMADAYMSQFKYKVGTARRQASEMFSLFPVVGIASKAEGRGGAMTVNPNSTIVAVLKATAEAKAAAAAEAEPLAA